MICSKCSIDKEEYNFSKHGFNKNGTQKYHNMCKDCSKIYRKEYLEKNRERINELKRINYQNNREHINEREKAYRKDNPDKRKRWDSDYQEKHKEKIKEWKHQFYLENKESILLYVKEYSYSKRLKEKQDIIKLSQNTSANTILYILQFTHKYIPECIFYKIGVTEFSVKYRYAGYTDYNYNIVSEYYFPRKVAYSIEYILIQHHKNSNLGFDFTKYGISFPGYTECFRDIDNNFIQNSLNLEGNIVKNLSIEDKIKEDTSKCYKCQDCTNVFSENQIINTNIDNDIICPHCGCCDVLNIYV